MFSFDRRILAAKLLNRKSAPVVEDKKEDKSQVDKTPETPSDPTPVVVDVVDEVNDVATSDTITEDQPKKRGRKKKEEVVSEENVGDA